MEALDAMGIPPAVASAALVVSCALLMFGMTRQSKTPGSPEPSAHAIIEVPQRSNHTSDPSDACTPEIAVALSAGKKI
jgi:hypothetical protein